MKIAGSGSGSIRQGYGSADPDPYQNFMDPQHCGTVRSYVDLELLHEGEGFLGTALPLQLFTLQAGAQVVTLPPIGYQG